MKFEYRAVAGWLWGFICRCSDNTERTDSDFDVRTNGQTVPCDGHQQPPIFAANQGFSRHH